MKKGFLLLLYLTTISSVLYANQTEIFAVQVGTYKEFADDARNAASQYGEVHIFTFKNLSRVTVGEFTNRQEANALLKKLKQAGFNDAFVRRTGYVDLSKSRSVLEKFNVLISEMDAHAFYLDGSMYLYQGNGYIKIHKLDKSKL